jgi:hypothetical protein
VSVVTICTTLLNTQKPYIFSTQFIYGRSVILRENDDYICKQHSSDGLCVVMRYVLCGVKN